MELSEKVWNTVNTSITFVTKLKKLGYLPFAIIIVLCLSINTTTLSLFQEGWPQNALQLASVLLLASKTVSGCASGRGLATPAQFVDQVLINYFVSCRQLFYQISIESLVAVAKV